MDGVQQVDGAQGEERVVLFDLDKTLIAQDCGRVFITRAPLRTPWRAALALLVTPLILPLFGLRSSRRWGILAWFWLGTVGLSESRLRALCNAFAAEFLAGRYGPHALPGALEALAYHRGCGHRIVVVTGTFAFLAEAIVREMTGGAEVVIVGSSVRPWAFGFTLGEHCYGRRKPRMVAAAGFPARLWAYGYSDCVSDIPLLRRCLNRRVVNPDAHTLAKYRAAFGDGFSVARWPVADTSAPQTAPADRAS